MICDHPESARTYETLIYPKACQRADERVVRCQRCGAVIYTEHRPAPAGGNHQEGTPQ